MEDNGSIVDEVEVPIEDSIDGNVTPEESTEACLKNDIAKSEQ